MKKYTEEDVKGLTKAQVIEKLTAEGVEFDANSKKDDLVTKLLEVETDQKSPENEEGALKPSDETPASEQAPESQESEEAQKENEEPQSPEAPGEEKKDSPENPESSSEETQSPETPEVGPSASVLEAEKKLAAMQTGKTADHAAFEAALSARKGGIPSKGSFEEELAKRRGDKLKKLSFGQALAARLRNVKKNS